MGANKPSQSVAKTGASKASSSAVAALAQHMTSKSAVKSSSPVATSSSGGGGAAKTTQGAVTITAAGPSKKAGGSSYSLGSGATTLTPVPSGTSGQKTKQQQPGGHPKPLTNRPNVPKKPKQQQSSQVPKLPSSVTLSKVGGVGTGAASVSLTPATKQQQNKYPQQQQQRPGAINPLLGQSKASRLPDSVTVTTSAVPSKPTATPSGSGIKKPFMPKLVAATGGTTPPGNTMGKSSGSSASSGVVAAIAQHMTQSKRSGSPAAMTGLGTNSIIFC